MDEISQRILRKIGIPDFFEKIRPLNTADFNSVLLKLFSFRTAASSPQKVLHTFRENRFAAPGDIDPVKLHQLELDLLSMASKSGITTKLLSPVAPLGSCSAFGCVSQNNVLSAVRNVEVLSDPTNLLAIMLADDLLANRIEDTGCTHYAAAERVVRGQKFQGKNSKAHFGIFCMVSTAKDKGSYLRERELLKQQLQFYNELLRTKYNGKMAVTLRPRTGYTACEDFFEKMASFIRDLFPAIAITVDTGSENNHYYRGLNFKIYMQKEGERIEIADGGFVDWISKMTGDKKDRCLISGLGLERLLSLPEKDH